MKQRWMGLIACLIFSQTQAASFDCAKAGTKVEKLICADWELSKLDDELAVAYAEALKSTDPASIKVEQRAWIKERNTCMNVFCIKRAYENRMRAISNLNKQSAPASTEPDGIALAGSFVPNARCANPVNEVWQRQCYPPDIVKLEWELAQVYAAVSASGKGANKIKADQSIWIKERNACAQAGTPSLCLDYAYRKRIFRLRTVMSPDAPIKSFPGKPKGEFFLSRAYDANTSFCQDFTRNLNQFRHLDFGECNPRLSSKFPEFSRPKWEEIPFDFGVAEQVVKGAINSAFTDAYLKKWLAASYSLRQAGKIRLWRLRIDIDGDGTMDTLIRMDPSPGEVASPLPKKPSLPYGCDYNFGALHLLVDQFTNLKTANRFNGSYFQDIVHNAADGIDYLVAWSPDSPAEGFGSPGDDTAEIGATAGVALASVRRDTSRIGIMCKIDWVLTGRYKPPKQPKPKREAASTGAITECAQLGQLLTLRSVGKAPTNFELFAETSGSGDRIYQGLDIDNDGTSDMVTLSCGASANALCTLFVELATGAHYEHEEGQMYLVRHRGHVWAIVGDSLSKSMHSKRRAYRFEQKGIQLICNNL